MEYTETNYVKLATNKKNGFVKFTRPFAHCGYNYNIAKNNISIYNKCLVYHCKFGYERERVTKEALSQSSLYKFVT